MPARSTNGDVEAGGSLIGGQPRQFSKTLFQNKIFKRAGDVCSTVVELSWVQSPVLQKTKQNKTQQQKSACFTGSPAVGLGSARWPCYLDQVQLAHLRLAPELTPVAVGGWLLAQVPWLFFISS